MIADRPPAKTMLLPGKTTHGHYQIEMACNACHTPLMGVKQDACLKCHAAELKAANDTHPAKKFNDPTNAARLAVLDAKQCLTCHREHVPNRTHPMGLSLPTDYCFHCHQETLQQRPSHEKFAYNSCATAGCHNYHDNMALYENFLVQHAGEPRLFESPLVRIAREVSASQGKTLLANEQDAPRTLSPPPSVVDDWAATAHAQAGVNCTACHTSESSSDWSDAVTHETCGKCHKNETQGFLSGKHGMRLVQKLSPMTPSLARQPMKKAAAHKELTCTACHNDHRFDTRHAAVDACVACHDDAHSVAYKKSSHYQLWLDEQSGDGPAGSGVSCATCHLPRARDESGRVFAQHNQNDNLRPNEKMVRTVCSDCHGLAFSLDSLADRDLIDRCFQGPPSKHIESPEMAKAWFDAKARKRKQ